MLLRFLQARLWHPEDTMAGGLVICLWFLAPVMASAQAPTVSQGQIRCADCSGTGQQPAPPGFDAAQVEFVARPIPAFNDDGQTVEAALIARVLRASPLMVEVLDSEFRIVDRKRNLVRRGDEGKDPATCGVSRFDTVDLASRGIVSGLQLNDLITGRWILQQDERNPGSVLAGRPVLIDVRKISSPVRYVHRRTGREDCANRSGRLVVYKGPEDGEVTTVYNDGAIHHRNAAYLTFTRERLSRAELGDLLQAFHAVNFDEMPTTVPRNEGSERSTLTLIGERYQNVLIADRESQLAPLVRRMDDLAARAMSHSSYLLNPGSRVALTILPWPYAEIDLEAFSSTMDRTAAPATSAWRQTVPGDFLRKLPDGYSPGGANNDPNRYVYFSWAGKLFRVARPLRCALAGPPCPFVDLEAAEVRPPARGDCVSGTPNCQTIVLVDYAAYQRATKGAPYTGGRTVYKASDPMVTAVSGRLWPPDMGVKLRDIPPRGTIISKDEYEAHKAIYFELLNMRTVGVNYIEDGFVYRQARLCQLESGSSDTCDLRPAFPAAVK